MAKPFVNTACKIADKKFQHEKDWKFDIFLLFSVEKWKIHLNFSSTFIEAFRKIPSSAIT